MNTQPPNDNAMLHKMAARLDSLHSDVGEVKSTMRQLTDVVSKLALIEERQSQATQSLERTSRYIEKVESKAEAVESRVDALERDQPMQAQTSQWVLAAVWGAAAGGAMFIAKQLGII